MSDAANDFDSQLAQLTSMGYDPVLARNALEAAGGNVETAIEIIEHDQTGMQEERGTNNNATVERVLDQWGQQLLGDKHPQVKEKAIEAGKTAKSAWSVVVNKLQEVDQEYKITDKAKDAIKTADAKIKDLDEKHDISGKATKAASDAGAALSRTVETAKRNFA